MIAVFDYCINESRRNRRFARSDITLQKTVHRYLRRHLTDALSYRTLLRSCHFKGEKPLKFLRIILTDNYGSCFLSVALELHKPELEDEKLFKNYSASCLVEHILITRNMEFTDRFVNLHKAELIPETLRQGIGEMLVSRRKNLPDKLFNVF